MIKRKTDDGGFVIEHNGIEYEVPPLTQSAMIDSWDAIEQQIVSRKKNPILAIQEVLAHASPMIQKELLDRAYKDLVKGDNVKGVSRDDIVNFIDSMDGFFWFLAYLMAKKNPQVNESLVREIFKSISNEEALAWRDQLVKG